MSITRFIVVSISCAIVAGCGAESAGPRSADAERGAELIAASGCGLCHEIPGIAGANGRVGPSLGGMGSRAYVAGMLRNTPDNLAEWIEHPQKVVPGNVMPDMGISRNDARRMAAYLQTLR